MSDRTVPMFASSLIRLGLAAVGTSLLLALACWVTGTPYIDPYTSVVWWSQIGGFILLAIGGFLRERG